MGIHDSNFVVNPTRKQLEKSPLNLVLTTNSNAEIGELTHENSYYNKCTLFSI